MVKSIKEWFVFLWPFNVLAGVWIFAVALALIFDDPSAGRVAVIYDGQSAVLTEDITVQARIPYQGDSLYEGKVLLRKGTMLVKPRVE